MTAARPPRGPLRPPLRWEDLGPRPAAAARPERALERPPAPLLARGLSLLGLAVGAGALGLYAVDPLGADYDTTVGVPVAGVLLFLVVLLARRVDRVRRPFDLGGLLVLAFSARLVAAYFRFEAAVDAREYHAEGTRLAESFRSLDFSADVGREIPGTGSVRWLTGLVHVFTGSNFFVTFLLFVFVAYLGLFCFYRAFETGFPEGDRKRYALLVFLWPTVVYWPSSLGKEACLVAAIGAASWGAARLLRHGRGGLVLLALGLAAVAMVRPHVAMIGVIAVVAALLLRRTDDDPVARLAAKVGVLAVVVVAGSVLSTATAEFLNLENLGSTEIDAAFETTVGMTTQGGSSFDPPRVTNPLRYPVALVTVLFRPFPGEVGTGLDGMLSSGTALFLLALTVVGRHRILGALRRLRHEPYIVYAATYVAVFVFVFSVVGNFGILDRQRTQMLPLYFVLLAAPLPRWSRPGTTAGGRSPGSPGADRAAPGPALPGTGGGRPRRPARHGQA